MFKSDQEMLCPRNGGALDAGLRQESKMWPRGATTVEMPSKVLRGGTGQDPDG